MNAKAPQPKPAAGVRMSEKDQVHAAIARIEAKLAAVNDEPSRFYIYQV